MSGQSIGRTSTASLTVVNAVASREGVDPLDLSTPLYDAVDPEGLDRLVESAVPDGRGSSPLVTFSYYGYDVAVDADGSVTLSE